MKKILLALLLLTPPAFAQAIFSGSNPRDGTQGSLVTANDAVQLGVLGPQWATVKFIVVSAGTATATAQYSIDGGINWFASPYAKRLSTVSANPTTQAISGTTLVTGDVWEVAISGNTTNVQILCGNSGTSTTVRLFGGLMYVPGIPVAATLYDVLSGVNTINSTGVLDLSGWNAVYTTYSAGGATTVALIAAEIADDGFIVAQTTPAAYVAGNGRTLFAAATSGVYYQPRFALVSTSALPPTKRAAFALAATAAQQTRLRIEVYR